jgi:hypothetical protein
VETCRDALTSFEELTLVLLGQLSDWAAAYTSDEAMQDRIVKELLRLIRNGSSGSA